MNIPGFTAEMSLSNSRGYYKHIANKLQHGRGVMLQQFAECETVRSCWGVVWMCRDHCKRWDGSSFSSNWYACGVCFGIGDFGFEFEF